ncbi:MAG: DNA-protecting protein DprA [Ruminococcaceae bacterium]|nr:DNA-protecting protein DprA [Oscillospiraceae bacterium]
MKQDSTLSWVWLQGCLGYASPVVNRVVSLEGQAERIYNAGEQELTELEIFSAKQIKRLVDKSTTAAEKILGECRDLGLSVITPESSLYPERLRNIYASPAVLYVSGKMPAFDDEVAIAMVGTRRATRYGRMLALELAERLARAGALIVSGGAPGIDTASHMGALNAECRTVAVLGCGINFPYNTEGLELRERIRKNGALISEYAPGTRPSRLTFPQRNRIIAGLSAGLVVVEAGMGSGSLITADMALEQSKEVFAVPGRLGEAHAAGVNKMLFDGAHAVLCPYDVLREFVHMYPHRLDIRGTNTPLLQLTGWSSDLPENERRAMKKMGYGPGCLPDGEEDTPSLLKGKIASGAAVPTQAAPEQPKPKPAAKKPEPTAPQPRQKETAKPDEEGERLVDELFVQFTAPEDEELLSEKAKVLLAAMEGDALLADQIAIRCGFGIDETLMILTELELLGYAEAGAGGLYRRI